MLELSCLLILGIHLAVGCYRSRRPWRYVTRMALLALASFVAEDTCIRLYGFYAYDTEVWSVFADRMPVMVMLIWPGVILSSWELARLLVGDSRDAGRVVPLVGAALVLADASFIEAIAVRAGLWRWFEPGFFGVPPIGVLGWAFFAGICMTLFARNDARKAAATADLPVLLVAPLLTHVMLVVTWWGAARWLSVPIADWVMVCLAWSLALPLTLHSIRSRANARIPLGAYMTRLPAAVFFLVLLALYWSWSLVAYALAFVPPYVSLGSWSRRALREKFRIHPGRAAASSRSVRRTRGPARSEGAEDRN